MIVKYTCDILTKNRQPFSLNFLVTTINSGSITLTVHNLFRIMLTMTQEGMLSVIHSGDFLCDHRSGGAEGGVSIGGV